MLDQKMIEMRKWNSNHTTRNSTNFVTDTTLDEIVIFHEFELPVNKWVMEIGVGYGKATKALHELGNTVIGVDVSSVALENVEQFTDYTMLSENLECCINPVDLAFAHLVFQHNNEYELQRLIECVPLRPGGIFSFQFATLNPQKTKLPPAILEDINKGMLFYYSVEKMREIVSRTSKKVKFVSEPRWFEDASFDWHVFHVENKSLTRN